VSSEIKTLSYHHNLSVPSDKTESDYFKKLHQLLASDYPYAMCFLRGTTWTWTWIWSCCFRSNINAVSCTG